MKRIGTFHLLAVIAAVALCAPAANAGSRCSDEPEPCVKSSTSLSRPVARVVTKEQTHPSPALQAVPAMTPTARKAAAPARKPVAKPARTTPTPGMGMLLKLSNGSGGDISWLPARGNEPQRQGWVL